MTRRLTVTPAVAAALLGAACSNPPTLPPTAPIELTPARLTCSIDRIDANYRSVDITYVLQGGRADAVYRGSVDWGDGEREDVRVLLGVSERPYHRYERRGRYSIELTARNEATNDRLTCGLSAELSFCNAPHVDLDDDFTFDGRWAKNVVTTPLAGIRETDTTLRSGGNPEGYRKMTHEFTQTTSPTFVDIFVHHMYMGLGEVDGPIDVIRYREDRIKLAPLTTTSAVAGGAVILQNGVYHVAPLTGGQFSNTSWERVEVTLRETDFTPRPDFSATAGRMRFGYMRANSNRFPLVIEHGIDNWRVEICR